MRSLVQIDGLSLDAMGSTVKASPATPRRKVAACAEAASRPVISTAADRHDFERHAMEKLFDIAASSGLSDGPAQIPAGCFVAGRGNLGGKRTAVKTQYG